MIARFATPAPCVSVSVALLLPAAVSVCPPPAVTVAVFTRLPVVPGPTVPMIVIVSSWPAPAGRLAFVKLTPLPVVAFVPQLPVPVTAHVAVAPVIAAGTASAMLKPVAVDGPALVTVSV